MSKLANSHEASQPDETPTYYVYDFSKLTLAELWRLASGRGAFAIKGTMLLAKLSGKPMRRGVPSLYDNVRFIDFQEIPDDFLRTMKPGIDALESAGYVRSLAQKSAQSNRVRGYSAHLLSSDRLSAASVTAIQGWIGKPVPIVNSISISSRRSNGIVLKTTGRRSGINHPPEIKTLHLTRAPSDQIIARHRRRIVDCADAQPINNAEYADKVVKWRRRYTEFQVARGLFVPATPDEMNRHRDQIVPFGEF
jgi:hypothetical protein